MQKQTRVDRERLKRITQTIINLPTLPTIVAKMLEIIDDPRSSARSLTRLINTDQVLTARILKLANSSFYGFPNPISTINLAVVVLGFETIKNLGLSVSVISRFARARTDGELLDYSRFWEHCVGVGVASRMLARMHGLRAIESEAFVAGLIHDIGKVILSQYQTDRYSESLQIAREEQMLIARAEERVFEANHTEVGSWLARRWNLPETLVEAIRLHHVPLTARIRPELCAIVHFADILARAARIGSGGDDLVPPFYRGVLRLVPLRRAQDGRVDLPFYLEALNGEMETAETFINIVLGKYTRPESLAAGETGGRGSLRA
ncbi:HDOD domain-containing protein [bacterium]|nr:HDOD domain-containing protein [bacterium]